MIYGMTQLVILALVPSALAMRVSIHESDNDDFLVSKKMVQGMEFQRWLGTGAFGSVAWVTHARGEFALKFERLQHLNETFEIPFQGSDYKKIVIKTCQQDLEKLEAITRDHPFCAKTYGTIRLTTDEIPGQFLDASQQDGKTKQLFSDEATYVVTLMELGQSDLAGKINDLDEDQKICALYDVSLGLANIHKLGLCHFDLKPDNVLLTKDERLVLMDFGSQVLRRQKKSVQVRGKSLSDFTPKMTLARARATDVGRLFYNNNFKKLLPSEFGHQIRQHMSVMMKKNKETLKLQLGVDRLDIDDGVTVQKLGYPSAQDVCHALQKYYFNRDMTADEFWTMIDPHRRRRVREECDVDPQRFYDLENNYAQKMVVRNTEEWPSFENSECLQADATRVCAGGWNRTRTRDILLSGGMLAVTKGNPHNRKCRSVRHVSGINNVFVEECRHQFVTSIHSTFDSKPLVLKWNTYEEAHDFRQKLMRRRNDIVRRDFDASVFAEGVFNSRRFPSEWNCTACGQRNGSRARRCFSCGMPKVRRA